MSKLSDNVVMVPKAQAFFFSLLIFLSLLLSPFAFFSISFLFLPLLLFFSNKKCLAKCNKLCFNLIICYFILCFIFSSRKPQSEVSLQIRSHYLISWCSTNHQSRHTYEIPSWFKNNFIVVKSRGTKHYSYNSSIFNLVSFFPF